MLSRTTCSLRSIFAKLSALALAMMLLAAWPVFAASNEEANAAHRRGDLGTAFRMRTELSAQGDPRATFNLALMYRDGQGTTPDKALAIQLFRKASASGLAAAQYSLAQLHEAGDGLPRDFQEAARLYRLAAEGGDADAQNNFGLMLMEGRGVERNHQMAIQWFEKAVAQWHTEAMMNLATILDSGEAGPPDLVRAAKFYRVAAERNIPEAQYNHGLILLKGGRQDRALGLMWLFLAADRDLQQAKYALAELEPTISREEWEAARSIANKKQPKVPKQ